MQSELNRTWNSWRAMRSRCTRPKDVHFKNYGARGVAICSSWLASFEAFVADMGVRPEGKTLDRVDANGNYEPANCRWATPDEQARNRRKFRDLIEFRGRSLTRNGWCIALSLGRNTLQRRLAAGWSIEKSLTTPGHKASGRIRCDHEVAA